MSGSLASGGPQTLLQQAAVALDPDGEPEPAPLPEDVPLDEAATDDEGTPTEGPPSDEAAPEGAGAPRRGAVGVRWSDARRTALTDTPGMGA